jgi:hypothetical protein
MSQNVSKNGKKSTSRLRSETVAEFTYRGIECEVRKLHSPGAGFGLLSPFLDDVNDTGEVHNGYMTGPINVASYDEADEIASAHGGFTWFEYEGNGHVTLGFDTGHHHDGPDTQNVEFVTQAIKDAVDSLYAAGVVAVEGGPS